MRECWLDNVDAPKLSNHREWRAVMTFVLLQESTFLVVRFCSATRCAQSASRAQAQQPPLMAQSDDTRALARTHFPRGPLLLSSKTQLECITFLCHPGFLPLWMMRLCLGFLDGQWTKLETMECKQSTKVPLTLRLVQGSIG